jgi:sulfur carrier protein ThiS
MKIAVCFLGELKKYDPNLEWANVHTIADIVAHVPGLNLNPMNFLVSRNGEMTDIYTKLEEGDEIRFLPMIMGG